MSLRISDSIGEVRAITGQKPRTVGATLYLDGQIDEDEASRIRNAIDPQEIKLTRDLVGDTITVIYL